MHLALTTTEPDMIWLDRAAIKKIEAPASKTGEVVHSALTLNLNIG